MLVSCWWFCRPGLALSILLCSVGFVFASMSSDASLSLDIDRDRTRSLNPLLGRVSVDPDRDGIAVSDVAAIIEVPIDQDRWEPPCGEYRKSIRLGRWIAPPHDSGSRRD